MTMISKIPFTRLSQMTPLEFVAGVRGHTFNITLFWVRFPRSSQCCVLPSNEAKPDDPVRGG